MSSRYVRAGAVEFLPYGLFAPRAAAEQVLFQCGDLSDGGVFRNLGTWSTIMGVPSLRSFGAGMVEHMLERVGH